MAKGLPYIWASAIASMFLAYVMFQFLTPVTAIIDTVGHGLMHQLNIDPRWMAVYDNYISVVSIWIPIFIVGALVSAVVYIITNSGRKTGSEEMGDFS